MRKKLIFSIQEKYLTIDNINNAIIGLFYDIGSKNYTKFARELLQFTDEFILGTNQYSGFGGNASFMLEVNNIKNKKILRIYDILSESMDKPYEELYISPQNFKKILETWIQERELFEKDMESYKKELEQNGEEISICAGYDKKNNPIMKKTKAKVIEIELEEDPEFDQAVKEIKQQQKY